MFDGEVNRTGGCDLLPTEERSECESRASVSDPVRTLSTRDPTAARITEFASWQKFPETSLYIDFCMRADTRLRRIVGPTNFSISGRPFPDTLLSA